MTEDLNTRAARAMGLGATKRVWYFTDGKYFYERNNKTELFDPEHDANATRELLMEVGRRGLARKFSLKLLYRNQEDSLKTLDDDTYEHWLLTAPLPLLVEAACEVLEGAKE